MFRLQDTLESDTGVRPSVVELFRHTTVAAQVAVIRKGGDVEGIGVDSRTVNSRQAKALREGRERLNRRSARRWFRATISTSSLRRRSP